jgi:hypothetical protein
MPAASGDHEILAEYGVAADGTPLVKALRQVVVRTPTEVKSIPLPKGWSAEQFAAAVKARGLEGTTPLEVYLDDDEKPDAATGYLRSMLQPVFGKFGAVNVFGGGRVADGPVRQIPGSADISTRYFRGVAKVGFHYFLWASNIFRGDEPCFEPMRQFIRYGEGHPDSFVEFNQPPVLPELAEGKRLAAVTHMFLARLEASAVWASLHFFLGPLTRTPQSCLVRIASRPPLRFRETTTVTCHQARYIPTLGHDGELTPVDVWVRRILTADGNPQ